MGKVESRNIFQLSIFLFSVFAFGFVDHRGHDGHEFIGFFFHWQSVRRSNPTFFSVFQFQLSVFQPIHFCFQISAFYFGSSLSAF
jgi:hypothetical protein